MADMFMMALLVGAATLLGFSFSQNLTNRRKTLQGLLEALEKMKTYIDFSAKEILQIVPEVFASLEGFREFENIPQKDTTFIKRWDDCVCALPKITGLNKEDKELLLRFSEGIGVSDVTGQIAHINMYSELFNNRLRLAAEDEDKKSRVYKILGFSLGLTLTLIIV